MKYVKKRIPIEAYQTKAEMYIETLEGTMHASVGDYIITGVNGERYPCKPDIFEKTYEPYEEDAVSREALREAMYHRAFETDGDTMWQSGCWIRYRAVEQVIKESPSFTPKQKRGKWEERETFYAGTKNPIEEWQSARCSICGKYHTTPYMYFFNDYNFCPNCGARMI